MAISNPNNIYKEGVIIFFNAGKQIDKINKTNIPV